MVNVKDEKLRQRVREESEELRQLKSALVRGYVNKEREKQILEKIERQQEAIVEEIQSIVLTEQSQKEHQEAEEQAEKEKQEKIICYKSELGSQLIAQREAEERAYCDYLEEQRQCDDMITQIQEEDRIAREAELAKKEEQRQFIEKFKQEQAEWRANEIRRNQEEDERVARYKAEKDKQEKEMETKKADNNAAKEYCQEKLGNMLTAIRQEQEEFEKLVCELAMNEQEERAKQAEKERDEKVIRDREELMRVHQLHTQMKLERQAAEQAQENLYRAQIMAKFAEDDRIEQMNAQKRRMKQLEHKKAVEELIRIRREKKEESHKQAIAEREREVQEARIKAQIIEEERQVILQQHADQLLGYLPKGVIRDSKDLERLGEKYIEAYKPTSQREFEKHFDEE
ncbi:unnamed protein product [Oikopleura dioica]|uniref:Meiosis-specific nuclear structural protein 1 n=1 Tax=Oikopleura dioica TaxID=34765 RepID=E4WX03_OIKDI|nr:unnamed protein product [Oikopleura dioica]